MVSIKTPTIPWQHFLKCCSRMLHSTFFCGCRADFRSGGEVVGFAMLKAYYLMPVLTPAEWRRFIHPDHS
jgi:hypothetical protein